jgi:hypothetical protein
LRSCLSRSLPPASSTTLDYQGYGFETGGFPPSATGDELRNSNHRHHRTPALGVDFATEELTGWISGLVSNGPQDAGDGTVFYTFSTGRMEIYRDTGRDHDLRYGAAQCDGAVDVHERRAVFAGTSRISSSISIPRPPPAPMKATSSSTAAAAWKRCTRSVRRASRSAAC